MAEPQVVGTPEQIETPAAFAAALTRLREQAGKSVRTVARETSIPASTLGGYFSGRHLPPVSQPEAFEALLTAVGVSPTDYGSWFDALHRVRRRPGRRTAETNPYRGLASYGIDDAEVFFGREELIDRVLGKVADLPDRGGPAWVTLLGASGSGKSSLLRAGVLARLRADGRPVQVLTPRGATAAALAVLEPRTVLGLDQMEEIFGPDVSEPERASTMRALIAFAEQPGNVVVAALRADLFGRCIDEPALVPLLQDHQVVGVPTLDELRRVIAAPAAVRQRELEPELVDLILSEASVAGESDTMPTPRSVLPLVSHALSVMWEHSRGPLRVSAYVASGRLDGAISRTAEAVWERLDAAEQEQTRRLFNHLVAMDDTGVVMRRHLARSDAEALVPGALLEQWVSARIVTADVDTVAISHEVLLRAWQRLQEWVREDAGRLQLVHRIGRGAEGWLAGGKEDADLLRGAVLELVVEQQESEAGLGLPPTLATYVAASRRARDHDLRRERARRRRLRVLLACVSVLAMGASLLSVALVRSVQEARDARAAALSRQVALSANGLGDKDPALAAQLALVAYQSSPTVEARSALLMTSARPSTTRLLGRPGSMKVAYSPDGRWIVAATADGKAHFYAVDANDPTRAPTQGPVLDLPGEPAEQWAEAFAPNGDLLVIGSSTGQLTLIDLTDPERPTVLEQIAAAESGIQALAFSPDGDELAAATGNELLRWQVSDTRLRALPTTRAFDGAVKAVAYSTTGLVATGSQDGAARLWRRGPGDRLVLDHRFSIGPADRFVFTVAFSPDGHTLAAGGNDHLVHLWNTRTHRPLRAPLEGFPSWVNAIAFSHDGAALAAVGSSNAGWVWSTATWQPMQRLVGPTNFTSVDFAPQDDAVVTGEITGTTQVIRLGAPPQLGDTTFAIAYGADGDRLYASVGPKAPAIVQMDTTDPRLPHVMGTGYRHEQIDGAGAISPDGTLAVAGSMTGQRPVFRLNDRGTGEPVAVLTDDTTITESVGFSSNGLWVATVSDSEKLQIYAVDGLRAPAIEADIGALPLSVAFQPGTSDRPVIAVAATDKRVHLYRLDTARRAVDEIGTAGGFDNWAYAVAFAPDGRTLFASSADRTLRVYDVSDPTRPRGIGGAYDGPRDVPASLGVSADGRFLAAAANDDSVWVWQVDDGRLTRYAELRNLGARPKAVAFDPRGGVLAAGGVEGRVGTWLVGPRAVENAICRTVGTPITREEWRQYLPDVAYDPPCSR